MTRRGRRGPGCAMVARMSGIRHQFQRRRRGAGQLLDLARGGARDAPIGNRGGEHRDIGRQRRLAGVQHLLRAFHALHRDAGGIGHRYRSADQRHARAQFGERRGDRMALPSAGAVGDVAHRIDRLVRRSAGDQRVAPGQRPRRRQQRLDRRQDRRRFGEPARAEFVAGHRALVRPDDMDAARGQQRHVRHASPHAATCARSSPARPAPACRSPAAASRQDRPRGPPPSSPGCRPRPAPPRRGRRCAKAGCAPSRFRRSARTGRCRPCLRSAPAATAA